MPILPDDNYSTLAQIVTKVRRLTRSPSVNQLSDQQIYDYINTFVLYDFPQHLKLFSLRKVFSFYTQPNIDVYANNTVNPEDPLYNFINKIVSIHGPVYVAGLQCFFTQDREQFFKIYPNTINSEQIGTGDGINHGPFVGTLSSFPIIAGDVTISSIGLNNLALTLRDQPIYDAINGWQLPIGNLVEANNPTVIQGSINYVTGDYNLDMPGIVALNQAVYCQDKPYTASKPNTVLFYDDKFILRPIPDIPYKIEFEAEVRPTELLASTDAPKIAQWWQYIAYGAAKKVFEDRLDQDSIQLIMPEYKQQELLVLRATLMQMSNERSNTIFTGAGSLGNYDNGFGWSGY